MSIGKILYRVLIAPRHHDEDIRNREIVLNTLLSGTLAILILTVLLLVGRLVVEGDTFLAPRALAIAIVTLFVGGLFGLSRRGRHKTASLALVIIYYLQATAIILQWGINVPTAVLLYGLVIVLAGILVGPVFSLYSVVGIIATQILVQIGVEKNVLHPDLSWTTSRPGMTDVAGFAFIFVTIALVTWLFNQQMARSLHKAEKAEAELLDQKSLLEVTVEERTRELQHEQLEKIQQMYRFAELGQLSTAMMHELANHLTSLTLNIEGLQGQNQSETLKQAKRSIRYIDDMVVRVRDQLHGRANIRPFNIASEMDEIIKIMRHRGQLAGVELNWRSPDDRKQLRSRGEPIRFRQMMANLIGNGLDAYGERKSPDEHREVLITATNNTRDIIITVDDWGSGVPKDELNKLFRPFHSTKDTGMGMGLFIVKQIAEEHFGGSVAIDTTKKHTRFTVKLPRAQT
ncbi:MAG TPA: ATP-binding protein [Candidatus Pristimantibacillus sp.]|nr:ATP-binding protein [Candidatus Pristimantibacillus sp.]